MTYRIVDEPKANHHEQFIVNPTAILFAAMLLPVFFHLPSYLNFLLPFLWLISNSYLLGSPTFAREIMYSVAGLGAIAFTIWGFGFLTEKSILTSPSSIRPYLRTLINALFFAALYKVVFMQSVPFAIYSYLKEQRGHV